MPPAIGEARRAVARVALAPRAPTGAPLIEACRDLLAPMRDFPCPHHLPGGVMDHGQSRGLGARVDFDPQRLWTGIRHNGLEDEGEGIATEHGGAPAREQQAGAAWMHRSERRPLLIDDQHARHLRLLHALARLRLRG